MFKRLLRRAAIEAALEGAGIPPGPARKKLSDTINDTLMEGYLMQPKPGYKTTEFWVTLLTVASSVISAAAGAIPNQWGGILATVAGVAYSISRGLAKQNGGIPEGK